MPTMHRSIQSTRILVLVVLVWGIFLLTWPLMALAQSQKATPPPLPSTAKVQELRTKLTSYTYSAEQGVGSARWEIYRKYITDYANKNWRQPDGSYDSGVETFKNEYDLNSTLYNVFTNPQKQQIVEQRIQEAITLNPRDADKLQSATDFLDQKKAEEQELKQQLTQACQAFAAAANNLPPAQKKRAIAEYPKSGPLPQDSYTEYNECPEIKQAYCDVYPEGSKSCATNTSASEDVSTDDTEKVAEIPLSASLPCDFGNLNGGFALGNCVPEGVAGKESIKTLDVAGIRDLANRYIVVVLLFLGSAAVAIIVFKATDIALYASNDAKRKEAIKAIQWVLFGLLGATLSYMIITSIIRGFYKLAAG